MKSLNCFRFFLVLLFLCLSVSWLAAQEDRVRQRQRNQETETPTEQPAERPAERRDIQPDASQKVRVRGTLLDELSGESIAGAYVKVQDELQGAVTDESGYFEFQVDPKDSILLQFSFVGYQTRLISISPKAFPVLVKLKEDNLQMDEVVVSTSRKSERLMESPVTVERMTVETLQNSASLNMLDAVANLKGVDRLAQSLTFNVFNTRGFNSRTNTRVVSRVDGMDMQAPGLNFPTNALTGPPSIDIASVELIPGAASAL